jgi:ribonuclease P protein component
MLAKRYKLPVQEVVARTGQTLRSEYFSLKIFPATPGASEKLSRFGVVVSNNVARQAVQRNRIRRAVFRFFKEQYNSFPPADYLAIAHKKAATLKKEGFRRELQSLTEAIIK